MTSSQIIKEDDKFFSRLLTKEKSMANSSFRVYYGGAAGSVPFMWESQPGTPKHKFSETTLPPLTPPPSFHSLPEDKSVKKKPSKPNLLHTILPRLSQRKPHFPPPPPSPLPSPPSSLSWSSSLSSSSSSSSTLTTPSNLHRIRHRRVSSSRLSFDSKGDQDEYQSSGYPTSSLCSTGGFSGCNSIMVMKNAFLSIVGHRSDRGTTTV